MPPWPLKPTKRKEPLYLSEVDLNLLPSHTILASAWEAQCIMRYPHLPTFEAGAEEGISVGEDEGEDLVAPTMEEAT